MLDEKDKHEVAGTLTYNSEWNAFELDGYELQCGQSVEVSVFGYWIPGQIALDTAGWYLFTLDQVSVRLQNGLPARFCESSGGSLPPLLHASQMHHPHILIVDDDPALLQALPHTVSLRLPQAQVDTSDSAQRALELIRAHDYDTIVSDIKMPGMDGLELLAKIHELRPETLTLLITGHGDHDLAIQALRGGAYDYVLKPIDRDYFVVALDHALQTRQLRRQVVEQQLALELHSKSLEHLVQQRTHELAQANATKDQIISVVSQELHFPLAHLKEITQVLCQKLEGADVAEIVSQGIAGIDDAIRRTDMLVEALLDTSRIETTTFILHRQRRDLVALCQATLEEYTARTGVALACEYLDAPLEAEVDVDRLRQLVIHLLSHAREHSTKSLPITVTLRQAGNQAVITVSDVGSGSAWGLDYYVWRKMVEQLGGRLEFQSFPDNRSTCFIMLPHGGESTTEHTDAVKHAGSTKAVWMINV
ncbi:MAG TPA: response regulator [Ktedonobacteraceae bacterium]